MSDERPTYRLDAPGASSGAAYELPAHGDVRGRRRAPRIDEHVIRPEVDRKEMIDGEIRQTSPADLPHAMLNGDLDYLLRAHVAPNYRVATDLLTRHDEDNDFASDSAVVREGIDPATGSRYCEELAFEVVSQQTLASITRKAPTMIRRGVHRVFAVMLKKRRVAEWQPEAAEPEKGKWVQLPADAEIVHPSLSAPMPVAAILDAASADDTVARALAAKGNPVIQQIRAQGSAEGKAEGKTEGIAEGMAEAIAKVLEGRGLELSPSTRERILGTRDLATLETWLPKAGTVSSPEDLFDTPSEP